MVILFFQNNVNGMQLKDMMIEEGIVKDAVRYVSGKTPLASKYETNLILLII